MQKNKARRELRPSNQTARLPIGLADRLLVFARWAIILASGAMLLFEGFGGGTFVLPMAVWFAAVAYNLPISFYDSTEKRSLPSSKSAKI